jgi:hypothetical protein
MRQPARVDRGQLPAVRAAEVDDPPPARFSFSTRAASASTAANAAAAIGASLRFSRSSAITAPQAADPQRPVVPGRGRLSACASAASCVRGLLDLDDVGVLEQVAAGELVEHRVVPAQPLERHHAVLDLFVAVVQQHGLQGAGPSRRRALLVPVDGLQLLDERDQRAMQIARPAR